MSASGAFGIGGAALIFGSTVWADYPATVIADSPLLYYRFEDAEGVDALQDSSGNENHSEEYVDVRLGEEGAVGRAAGFEGFGSVLTGLLLDPSEGDFSIEVLVKPYELSGTQVMVSNQDGAGTGRSNLILGADGNINSYIGGGTTPSGSLAMVDEWTHVVLTYDADGPETIRFYVNGEPSGSGTRVVESADGNWVIGSHKSQGSQFTNAVLDEVAIYGFRLDDPDGDDDTGDSKVAAHYGEYLRQTVVIAGFSAGKAFVSSGEPVTLSWSVGEAEVLTIDNGIGDVLAITVDGEGSIEVRPTATTTYTLSGEGPAGNETAAVTITVNAPPVIDAFAASAEAVIKGQTVTLNWATSGADSVTIEPGIGTVEAIGQREVQIDGDTTFILTAANAHAGLTAEVTVTAKDGDPGLEAHWRVGEAAGETDGPVLVSEISRAQDAAFAQAPEWVRSDLAPTATTAAVAFDGFNFADAAGYTGVAGAGDRTVAFWMKAADTQNAFATMVSWGTTATSQRWDVRIGGSFNIRTEVAGSGSEGSAEIVDGRWHHVAVVFANDGTPNIGDIVFYIDGEPDALSLPGNTEVNTSDANTVRIGASRTLANRGFTGHLDDIRIYSRALDRDEVRKVMDDGGGPASPFVISRFIHDGATALLTWKSTPGRTYGIDYSADLQNWVEIDDGVPAADGTESEFRDSDPPEGAVYYRVRQE